VSRSRTRLDLQAIAQLLDLVDYAVPFAIRAVATLGIADHIDHPRPITDIATDTHTHTHTLHRILRLLATKGIFTETSPGHYGPTSLSNLLRTDHPLSLRALCYLMPHDIHAWAALDHTLRTGTAAFDHVHHQNYWDYLATHPEHSTQFDTSQQAATQLELLTALRAYDWTPLTTIVDIGGGNGTFLTGILTHHPHIHGTLIELPHVTPNAHPILAHANLTHRITILPTNFFTTPPPPADAYILKAVLSGWDDEHALVLLRNIRGAMPPNSRLLVLDSVATEDGSAGLGESVRLQPLVLGGGPERTTEDYARLFADADLHLVNVIPQPTLPILDVRPGPAPF